MMKRGNNFEVYIKGGFSTKYNNLMSITFHWIAKIDFDLYFYAFLNGRK
jgi:hypothetical protein